MSNNTDLFGIEPINITGTLPTAQLPIIPKNKGGFGQDVSLGLTNGYVAVVSGGQITIGPPPASPSRAQLAILSDPFFNNTQWYSGQFIALDSSNKSYSTSFWNNIAGYSPAVVETLSKFTIQLSAPLSTAANISIWVQPLAGVEADTGITIAMNAGNSFAQNLVDTVVLNPGDTIKFTTDAFISVQWVTIFSNRQ